MKSKDQLSVEKDQLREMALTEGWKLVLKPWLENRLEYLKNQALTHLDPNEYAVLIGEARAYKGVLAEVEHVIGRNVADLPDPE